jgi:ubiquinone/menaquinone biosynthesis C-methylase UbiE
MEFEEPHMLARFIAKQLRSPSNIFGKLVMAPLWNRRNVALNEAALEALDLLSNDRVLEVGFGGGYLLGRMASIVARGFLAGVDASRAMVDFSKGRYRSLIKSGRLELNYGIAESLPYPSGHFNKVCTINSLFYFADAQKAMSEIYRVLESDGRVVVCLTCKPWIENKSFAGQEMVLYEDDEVLQMLELAGFELVEVNYAADRYRQFMCVIGVP